MRRVTTTTARELRILRRVQKCLTDSLFQYPDHSRARGRTGNYEGVPCNIIGLHKISHSARCSLLAAFLYESAVYDMQAKVFFITLRKVDFIVGQYG